MTPMELPDHPYTFLAAWLFFLRYLVTRKAVKTLKAAFSADDEPSNNTSRKRPGPRD